MDRQKKEEKSNGCNAGSGDGEGKDNSARNQPGRNTNEYVEEARRRKILNEERRSSIWKDEGTDPGVPTNTSTKTSTTQSAVNEGRRSMLAEKRQISERSLQRQSRRTSVRQSLSRLQRGESSRSVLTTEKGLIAQRSQRRLDVRAARASESQSQNQRPQNPQMKQEAKNVVTYFPTPGTGDRVLPTLNENSSTSSLEYSCDSVAGTSRLPSSTFCWNVPSYPGNLVTAFVVNDDDTDSTSTREESGVNTKESHEDPEVFTSEIPHAEEVCKATVDRGMPRWKRYTILISIVMLLTLAVALTVTVVILQRQNSPLQTSDSSALSSSTQHDNSNLGNLTNTGIVIIKDDTLTPTDAPSPPNRIHATEPPAAPIVIIYPTEPPLVEESSAAAAMTSPGKYILL